MLFVVHIGDDCHFMIFRCVLLVVDQRVDIVILQKFLIAALRSQIVLLPMWVKHKGNADILVRLVFLPLIKSELQGYGIWDHFSNVVDLLKGGEKLEGAVVCSVEKGNEVVSWCEEQLSLFEIKLYPWGEGLVLGTHVEGGLTRNGIS